MINITRKALIMIVGFALAFHFVLMIHLTYRKVESIETFIKFHIESGKAWNCEDFNGQE